MDLFEKGLSRGPYPRKLYPPVGVCIYCGATQHGGNSRLGHEHIVPRMMGGRAFLPNASCRKCEAKTSAVETDLKRTQFTALPHYGLFDPGKKTEAKRKLARMHKPTDSPVFRGGQPVLVPLDDHPGFIASIAPEGPRILSGFAPFSLQDGCKFTLRFAHPFGTAGRAHGGFSSPAATLSSLPRLLYKIAHAFAVAELGLGSFKPLLIEKIAQREEVDPHHFIGHGEEEPCSADDEMHQVGFYDHPADAAGRFVTVRIRLFALEPIFTNYVVVGERA